MKLLLMRIRLNLIHTARNLQLTNRRRQIHTTLRLNVDLAAQRWSKLELQLARGKLLRGSVFEGLRAYTADGAGDGVCEDAAGFAFGVEGGPVAEVEFVEDFVEV
jgi:hypothetical protein